MLPRGDVTHWLDRIKVAYPAAYKVVARMLHPAAGERYSHHSYILKDLNRLREFHPNTKRIELGEALGKWLVEIPPQVPKSVDLIAPKRVLQQPEPRLHQHILEVTEQIEPEIESYIEVTQFNTPKFQRSFSDDALDSIPEPTLQPVNVPFVELEVDEEMTEVSEDNTNSHFAPPPPIHIEQQIRTMATEEHTNSSETSHSEHSLQPYELAEASLGGEVFATQQRAVILIIINSLLLLVFIYTVLF